MMYYFSAEGLKHTCLGLGFGEGGLAQQQGMWLACVVEPWVQPSLSHAHTHIHTHITLINKLASAKENSMIVQNLPSY